MSRTGIAWGSMGRDADPEAWVLLRAGDRAIMGTASSQGGVLRMAHALWDDLDASTRLQGPTIILQDSRTGDVRGCIARRTRMDAAAAQLTERSGVVLLRLTPTQLARANERRGERSVEDYILALLRRG